jgi:glutaryl-CoA dehydrogenase
LEPFVSDDQRLVLDMVRRFAEASVLPAAAAIDRDNRFPAELYRGLADLGLFGVSLPAEAGGSGLDTVTTCLVMEEIARCSGTLGNAYALPVEASLFLHEHGGAVHKRLIPGLLAGDILIATAATEPDFGSDLAGMRTTAERDGDTWVLNGAKKWIGNATFADHVIVWARDLADNQVKGFVVEKGTPGFVAEKIEGKIAFRIVENAEITLTGVRVPEANRLQRIDSFRDVAEILRATRGGVAWQALGVMIGAYEAALAYSKEREQFGRPIARFQMVQDKLVQSLGNITASWGMLVQLAKLQDAGIFQDEHSSLAKAFVTSRMREVVAWSREIFGGNGIVLGYDVARFFADAEAIYSFEGTREMNTLIVGKAITGQSAFV